MKARDGNRLPGSISGSALPSSRIWIQMKKPVAQVFPSRCDSPRRHLRQSMTTKVRIRPPCEKTVKTASEKSRLKNFTVGASFWIDSIAAPTVFGSSPGRLSSKTGVIVRYLKNTSPNFAICGMTV